MSVAVVTDSTAYLPVELSGAHDLTVVPLTVVVNGIEGLEGEEIAPAEVARALGARRADVRTSRLSGTYEAAQLAADEVGPQVAVVDSKTTGMGLGFAALAAGAAASGGAPLEAVRRAAVHHSAQVSTLFYVDTLEFLRRG